MQNFLSDKKKHNESAKPFFYFNRKKSLYHYFFLSSHQPDEKVIFFLHFYKNGKRGNKKPSKKPDSPHKEQRKGKRLLAMLGVSIHTAHFGGLRAVVSKSTNKAPRTSPANRVTSVDIDELSTEDFPSEQSNFCRY